MGEQLGVSVGQAGSMFLVFAVAMFAVGPFHAYLVDEYKGNTCSFTPHSYAGGCSGICLCGWLYEISAACRCAGSMFRAGNSGHYGGHRHNDFRAPQHRKRYITWAARLGMLVGVVLGIGMYRMYGFRVVTYLSVAAGLASIFFASRVYVAFRAPIGVSLCNMDRFLLPRAWVPAINMLLIAFVPGALLPLMFVGDYWSLAALAVLVFITVPFMKMFVKLSHHCQRGTANTTCHLSMEAGLLVGMAVACHLMDKAQIYHVASVAAMLAVFFFVLLTYPYYKKKRVR